jgi:ethylene-insensitive protein 2
MSTHNTSQPVELLALFILIGMLGLNIIFLVDMIFGNSDWAGDLRWNVGNDVFVWYSVILIAGFISLCLMFWLASTPLKSLNFQLNAQVLNRDMSETIPNLLIGSVPVVY